MVDVISTNDVGAPEFRDRVTPSNPLSNPIPDITLDGLKDKYGEILVPTYIPAGYQLRAASVVGEKPYIYYQRLPTQDELAELLGSEAMENMSQSEVDTVAERPVAELAVVRVLDVSPKVPSGSWSEVSVGGVSGIVVRGMWYADYDANRDLTNSGWDTDLAIRLFLEKDGWVYHFMSRPASALDESSLIRVAESLSSY